MAFTFGAQLANSLLQPDIVLKRLETHAIVAVPERAHNKVWSLILFCFNQIANKSNHLKF